MRFTVLMAPGAEPGEARSRAASTVIVTSPDETAAAARASEAPYLLLLAPGARPIAGAFAGVRGALEAGPGVLGGTTVTPAGRAYGWSLAPAPFSPLGFEPVPIAAAHGDPGADAVRGPVDVVAPGMILAARALLLDPLPSDPLARVVALSARARARGLAVVCRPAFACEAPAFDDDDRGRVAALAALVALHGPLAGSSRLPPALRRRRIARTVRLATGARVRVPAPPPRLTVLAYGTGAQLAARRARDLAPAVDARAVADPLAALRADLRIRGDRYLLVADAAAVPDAAAYDALIEEVESVAAPAVLIPHARCALIVPARIPQHVEPAGATLHAALAALADGARDAGRVVRVGDAHVYAPPREREHVSLILLAAAAPELLRMTATAAVENVRPGDELLAVRAASAGTLGRVLAAFPQLVQHEDAVDPLLTLGANRALAAARGDIVVLLADDVLIPAGTVDRLRAAFARVPALGAAFPAVSGAPGGEGVHDVRYADMVELRGLADEWARACARDTQPIDLGSTCALAVAAEALRAVGGIDPALGPTRRGIADLVLRLRAAGYAVVRCDDTIAHRFDGSISRSPLAAADAASALPAADSAAIARGFDPTRRVALDAAAPPAAAEAHSHALVVPVSDAAELEHAARYVAAADRAFDASAPVRVHVLLDGTASPADAAACVRPLLAASARGIDATVAVRIERVADLATWRRTVGEGMRIVVADGHMRPALDGLPVIDAERLTALLENAGT